MEVLCERHLVVVAVGNRVGGGSGTGLSVGERGYLVVVRGTFCRQLLGKCCGFLALGHYDIVGLAHYTVADGVVVDNTAVERCLWCLPAQRVVTCRRVNGIGEAVDLAGNILAGHNLEGTDLRATGCVLDDKLDVVFTFAEGQRLTLLGASVGGEGLVSAVEGAHHCQRSGDGRTIVGLCRHSVGEGQIRAAVIPCVGYVLRHRRGFRIVGRGDVHAMDVLTAREGAHTAVVGAADGAFPQ